MQTHTLTRAEIEAHDPEGGKGGRWLCPLPECSGHTDPRRHRSLSLALDTGLWTCHRCHAQGQLKEAWKPLEYKSPKEKKQEADTRRRAGLAKILAKAKGDEEKEYDGPDRFRLGTLCKVQDSREALEYLAGRGFTQNALELLACSGVRFAPDFGRRLATETAKGSRGTPSIVFPLRDKEGKLIASQGRFLTPWPSGQKFLTLGDKNAGTFATHGALEALQKGQPVAIVEAPFDALTLALAGIPTLALCGSAGAPEWLTRRAFGRRFLLAFDADNAGDEAAATLGAELGTLGAIVERLRPEGAKDFNDLLKAGGEVWSRTAEALRARMAREAIATKSKVQTFDAVLGEPSLPEVVLSPEEVEELRALVADVEEHPEPLVREVLRVFGGEVMPPPKVVPRPLGAIHSPPPGWPVTALPPRREVWQ